MLLDSDFEEIGANIFSSDPLEFEATKKYKDQLIDAAIHGTSTASFTVSGIGVKELLKADRKEVDKRFEAIKNKMEILVQ